MENRWTRFADPVLQSRLIRKAEELGAAFSIDLEGRLWFDDEEWCRFGDPHILTLDDEFGQEWAAVYADQPQERAKRSLYLSESGIQHTEWFQESGTFLVLDKKACPPDWEFD